MQTWKISLVNGLILIILGLWGYFGSASPSFTALIPVIFGGLLVVLNPGLKNQNKAIAHIVVLLTLLVSIGLYMPLSGALARNDVAATIRVSVMLISSIIALVFFVRSFIRVRRGKV